MILKNKLKKMKKTNLVLYKQHTKILNYLNDNKNKRVPTIELRNKTQALQYWARIKELREQWVKIFNKRIKKWINTFWYFILLVPNSWKDYLYGTVLEIIGVDDIWEFIDYMLNNKKKISDIIKYKDLYWFLEYKYWKIRWK